MVTDPRSRAPRPDSRAPHARGPRETSGQPRPSSRAAASRRRARAASSSARVRRSGRRSAGTRPPPPPAPCDRVRAGAPTRRSARARRRWPRRPDRGGPPCRRTGRCPPPARRSRRSADQVTIGGVRAVRHRPRVMDRPHQHDLDLAVRAEREPLIVGETPAVEALAPHPNGVVRSGEDRHPREAPEGGDLGVVVVQVGEQYAIRPLPRRSRWPLTAPAQDAVVASHQRVGDDPHAVEIHDGRGVTEPRDLNAQRAVPLVLAKSHAPLGSPAAPHPCRVRDAVAGLRRGAPAHSRWSEEGAPGAPSRNTVVS